MKTLVLVCESMADEPMEALGGRTFLETAKLPNLSRLSPNSKMGLVQVTPNQIAARGHEALFSILGYDPLQYFTGPAPIEATALNIPFEANEVVFYCDFVTAENQQLVDSKGGFPKREETAILIRALNQSLAKEKMRFVQGEGHRNFFISSDPVWTEKLDELETLSPESAIGKPLDKFLPKGPGDKHICFLMEKSREVLENHEINRVRIDLGENPANRIWLWGQGKRPNLPSFFEQTHLSGGVVADQRFVLGIAKLLGMKHQASMEQAVEENDFTLAYEASPIPSKDRWDFRQRLRSLEQFDSKIVSAAVRLREKIQDLKILVVSTVALSTLKKEVTGQPVPFLSSSGLAPSPTPNTFTEKAASMSRLKIDRGYKLLESFLKGNL